MTDDHDLSARRKVLEGKLKDHEAARAAADAPRRGSMEGMAVAFRLSTEFISAILVGAAFGFGLDWLLGTTPWLLIVFLLLGFVAGILNVLRSAGLIQTPQVGKRAPEREHDSQD